MTFYYHTNVIKLSLHSFLLFLSIEGDLYLLLLMILDYSLISIIIIDLFQTRT